MPTPLPSANPPADEPGDRQTNRLAQETSPYLRQHQHNPVDWYPWGPEALAKAEAEDTPILLSVGYSACHWCHVMERESFEDPAVAKLMNAKFVCVKVDREERPDVDAIYMQATLTLRGQGGWPMNVFLTPDLEPFYAGTYFPPRARHGLPSWTTVLASLAQAWAERRDDVVKDAARLTERLREAASAEAPGELSVEAIAAATGQLAAEFDPQDGGFGAAPKFPHVESLLLLLRHHARTGDPAALEMVTTTLRGMARGGIYDQLGGGFARYSVDASWLVPHFEKMLYDNAALTRAYLDAYQVTKDPLFHRVASETLDYVLREMTAPEGGFHSATDADSEGEEGKFFVWTPDEVQAVLGPEEARRVCAYYDVTPEGNFEGKSILNTPRPVDEVARSLGISTDALQASLNAATEPLYRARSQRVHPGLDDKVLTAWNGLMIGALSQGAFVLGEPRYLQAAERAAAFVLSKLVKPDGRLLRSYCRGEAKLDAYLEDYAYLADALIDLYEAGGDRRHLAAATLLGEKLLEDFAPEEGGAFYFTAKDHESLIVRSREGHDGATPNPNAVAAMALARLSHHLNLPAMRDAARAAVETYGQAVQRMPRAFCQALAVVDFLQDGPVELALVGTPGTPSFDALWGELAAHHLPNRVVAMGPGEPGSQDQGLEALPLLAGKGLVDGQAALYVCKDYACQAPISDPAALAGALR